MDLTHEDLRYWLGNEEWYPSRFTQNWLKSTPPDEAAETLTHIAEDAQPQPRGFFSRFALAFATTGFATSSGIAGGGPTARKVGVRAALLLASMKDPRAITPLVRVFDPYGFWQSPYQEEIESALIRLLSEATEQGKASDFQEDVRLLVNRTLPERRKQRELSGSLTNLLIASLRYLHTAGGSANLSLIREVMLLPIKTSLEGGNWARVKASASALLT